MDYSSRRRRFRRSLGGRPVAHQRPLPSMLRPAPPKRSNVPAFLGRLLLAFVIMLVVLSLAGAGAAYAGYSQLTASLKDRINNVDNHDAFQTTRLYDRTGKLLYEFYGAGKRTQVPYEQIAPKLVDATISIEDKTFFQNTGVDYEGILKAFGRSLEAGEATGGASTITQQLIKGVVLTAEERKPENVYRRKVSEIVLARELTQRYSKQQVLELYLNEIYYGNLAYGIEAASNVYFGVKAKDLSLAQASLLAGLPQLPNYYDPMNYLESSQLRGVKLNDGWLENDYQLPTGTPPPKLRQAAVLTQMVEEGYVSEADARVAAAQDLVFASQDVPLNAPHFVYYVRRLLEEQYGQDFANEGLSVTTSIDLDMQNMVQQKAAERIAELGERNIHNAAVVVMQPNTGQILSMVGSIDYNKTVPSSTPGEQGNVLDGQVNVAVRERQPGSALKPFTYLSAMEQGMTPATVLWDVPTEFTGGTQSYAPVNYNGRFNGPLRIRTALANSLNIPAVLALKYAGVDNTLKLLDRVGIKSGLKQDANYYGLALTLGGGEVTPLELTAAYNTLASNGRYYAPVAILKIVNGRGETVQEYKPSAGEPAINPDHAAIISDMLSDDNARKPVWGLGSKLKLSRPAAVKTGTSNDWRDAWAAGYTPYVTVGVWTGNNNNEATEKVESITGGGMIWHNVMEALFADPNFTKVLEEPYNNQLPIEFAKPADLKEQPICGLPGPFNNYREELFSPDMLAQANSPTGTASSPAARRSQGCNAYESVTVMRLSEAVSSENGETSPARYCRPYEGMNVSADKLTTLQIWNLPPADPDEKVEYRWNGSGDASNSVRSARNIPQCSAADVVVATPTDVPNVLRMPDLKHFGETQAREMLAAMGITNEISVDYQDRARIGDVYDQFAAYAVVSTYPSAGQEIKPGDRIVLGVRAPGDQSAPAQPAPTEASAPPESQPTPAPQPTPEQQPTPEPQVVIPGFPAPTPEAQPVIPGFPASDSPPTTP